MQARPHEGSVGQVLAHHGLPADADAQPVLDRPKIHHVAEKPVMRGRFRDGLPCVREVAVPIAAMIFAGHVQQFLVRQISEGEGFGVRQEIRMANGDHGFREYPFAFHLGQAARAKHDHDVARTGVKVFVLVARHHLQFDFGEGRLELCQSGQQKETGEADTGADGDGFIAPPGSQRGDPVMDRIKALRHGFGQDLPVFGEGEAGFGSEKKRRAQRGLKAGHLATDGGLLNIQILRGSGKTQPPRGGIEGMDLLEGDGARHDHSMKE